MTACEQSAITGNVKAEVIGSVRILVRYDHKWLPAITFSISSCILICYGMFPSKVGISHKTFANKPPFISHVFKLTLPRKLVQNICHKNGSHWLFIIHQ